MLAAVAVEETHDQRVGGCTVRRIVNRLHLCGDLLLNGLILRKFRQQISQLVSDTALPVDTWKRPRDCRVQSLGTVADDQQWLPEPPGGHLLKKLLPGGLRLTLDRCKMQHLLTAIGQDRPRTENRLTVRILPNRLVDAIDEQIHHIVSRKIPLGEGFIFLI